MKMQKVLGGPSFVRLGMRLARAIPSRPLYAVSRMIAWLGRTRRNSMFMAVRGNLAQVMGPGTSDEELDRLAQRAIDHAGRTYVDMFRLTVEDLRLGRVPVRIDQEGWEAIRAAFDDTSRGVMIVGPHTSNFDLAAQWFAAQDYQMQALSLADPDGGTQVVNRLRDERGMVMTPIDVSSLRQAVKRLRQGGLVLTGLDRPVSTNDPLIEFFGAPAHMPTGHIRLALQTGAVVVLAACTQDADGMYYIHMVPPLEMERTGDRDQEIAINTARVLRLVEPIIRSAPDQWLMFWPVWPERA